MSEREWEENDSDQIADDLDFIQDSIDIETLLERGYEQLNSYVQWLEQRRGVSARLAQQHCINVEALIDYLANQHSKSVAEINEYELRWFIFYHYLCACPTDAEIQLRLLDSLALFFEFVMTSDSKMMPIWVTSAMEESTYYHDRRNALIELNRLTDEEWEIGFRRWKEELDEDLDDRCLLVPNELGNGMVWSRAMGWYEGALYSEANKRWQEKRDELLGVGLSQDRIRDELNAEFYLWLDTHQARLEGVTPREIIGQEQLERVEDEDEESEDRSS